MAKLLVLCAWCGAIIQKGKPDKNGGVSHGMCEKCLAKANAEMDAMDSKKGSER